MKYRPPMKIERLTQLARSEPSPEMLELLWEIRRLHNMLRTDLEFVDLMNREFVEAKMPRPLAINMRRGQLLEEPCTAVMYRRR